MSSKDNTCMVIVTIEMGHQANFLKEPSVDGFTHDWTVFVGGYEGNKIENFVEKVVFNLHKTFKMPTRSLSAPPYKVSECGYAGFILPIDIYFKTKQKPRKITFMYDLFLNAKDSPPINNVRFEKLKFQNPTPDFKAKLIKAGGSEQGSGPPQPVVSDRFYISEHKPSSKPPETKHKEKKAKKVSPVPVNPSSPHPSLSSLSPMTSDEEPEKYVPTKREKDVFPVKKESSSSKKESSSKVKSSKYKSIASSEKERHSSENAKAAKADKMKEKEKSFSEHTKEVKKEKESGHKSKDSHSKHKEREGSHSSNKSSSSSLGEKKSSSSSHKEKSGRDKESGSKEKHKSSHKSKDGEEKSSSKDKGKHSHKESVPPSSSVTVTDPPKKSQDISKAKNSNEKEKHSKSSHKRSLSPGETHHESERKKIKRMDSNAESEAKFPKAGSVEKEKSNSSSTKISKDVKSKDSHKLSSASSSGLKIMEHKKKSSEKSKHSSHSSEGKSKPDRDNTNVERKMSSSDKHPDLQQRAGKSEKSERFSKSEKLAMSADFQPQLLLSPLKSRSEDEDGHVNSSENSSSKKGKSNSSLNSLSNLSSDHDSGRSDNDCGDRRREERKQIVSGLTDSDSDSDGPPVLKSPAKKSKQPTLAKDFVNDKTKMSKALPTTERTRKPHGNGKENSDKKISSHNVKDHGKTKFEDKEKTKIVDSNEVFASPKISSEEPNKNGPNVLAPNGVPISELISINEKIEKAQLNSNMDLINSIIDIISETDDFDIDDTDVLFDICSLDKNCVLQIQNIL